jgi:hypothetical protein
MKRLMLFWVASLVLVSIAALTLAQTRFPEPRILSGDDIGFRVEGMDLSGKPTGHVMVRVNGEWIEVGDGMTVRPVK